jgi:hypothetical protein
MNYVTVSCDTFNWKGVKIPLTLTVERWATVIQQLLMLILIIGKSIIVILIDEYLK